MAWSSTPISAADVALAAADKPIINGNSSFEHLASPGAQWRQSGSFASGSDETDAAFPTTRLYDRKTHLTSRPDSSQTLWYLIADFDTSSSEEILLATFDFLVILNHNLGSAAVDTLEVEIANNNDFTGSPATILSVGPITTSKRLVFLDLDHTATGPRRYTGLRFLRIKLQNSTGFLPEIGEVYFGRRRQLKHKPRVPWDPSSLHSDAETFVSRSGIRTTFARHVGRRDITARINPSEDAFKNDIVDWFRDTGYGTKPFIWIDDPNSEPEKAALVKLDEEDLDFPLLGPTEREISIVAREQGPHFVEAERNL